MFSATVAQNPTMPVNDGTKKRRNSPVVLNLLGVPNTGPKPPAFRVIHHKSKSPTPSINGAPMPAKNLIVSIPRQMTSIFSNQNAKKHVHETPAWFAALGQSTTSIE